MKQPKKVSIIRFSEHRRDPEIEADLQRIVSTLRAAGRRYYISALADLIEQRYGEPSESCQSGSALDDTPPAHEIAAAILRHHQHEQDSA